jgi:hypothetical protein
LTVFPEKSGIDPVVVNVAGITCGVQRQDTKKFVIVYGELSIQSGNLRTKINNIE